RAQRGAGRAADGGGRGEHAADAPALSPAAGEGGVSFFGPRLSLPLLAVAIAVPVPTAYQELLADDGQETVALLKLDAWEIGAGGANARRLPRFGGPLWIGAGEGGVGGTVPFYWSDDLWAG